MGQKAKTRLRVIQGGFEKQAAVPAYEMQDRTKTLNYKISGDDYNHVINTKRYVKGLSIADHLAYVVLEVGPVIQDFLENRQYRLVVRNRKGVRSIVDIVTMDDEFAEAEPSKLRCDHNVYNAVMGMSSTSGYSARTVIRHCLRICSYLIRCMEEGFSFELMDKAGGLKPYQLSFANAQVGRVVMEDGKAGSRRIADQ